MHHALAIIGPTASGKTALALQLAQHYPIEIISMDSALVYRDMNIGTAKPSQDELDKIPHHLIDIISPTESYSAASFVHDCIDLVADINCRNKLAVIVGGTMMYFNALTNGLNELPEADSQIRSLIQQKKQDLGLDALYQQLQQVDPITAHRLKPNDSQRIERAIEVYLLTGKPMSQLLAKQQQHKLPFQLHTVALEPEPRAQLHHIIAQRFHHMLAHGFLDELDTLKRRYELDIDMPSMRCVGYRQAWQYLEGNIDYDTFIETGIIATRQLAKRQMTWLRKLNPQYQFNPFNSSFSTDFSQFIDHFFAKPIHKFK